MPDDVAKQASEEKFLLEHLNDARAPLVAAEQYARGTIYIKSMKTRFEKFGIIL